MRPAPREPMPPAVRVYLACYNFLSALAWLAVLRAMFLHFSAAAGAARGTPLSRLWASLPGASRGLYDSVGGLLTVVQAAALLEIAHAALGLVRSPLATTALQVCARLTVLVGVTRASADAQRDWGFALMAVSWSLVEVPRYAFYLLKLVPGDESAVPYWLAWLRYSLFIVLYPPGIVGEVRELLVALPGARASGMASVALPNAYNFVWDYHSLLCFLLLLYIPGAPTMISHMWRQRNKELFAQPSAAAAAAGKRAKAS